MPIVAVNVIKVLFVVAIYGFLFYVARSMRGHVAGPPADVVASPPSAQRSASASRVNRSLAIEAGDGAITRYPLIKTVVIGRGAAADIQIDDDFASERHASFRIDRGMISVEDLGSTNGITVNGERINGRVELALGTTLIVGRTKVVIE